MSTKQTEQAATSQTAAMPESSSSRRLSLGGGNDGMGGPIYKVIPPHASLVSFLIFFDIVLLFMCVSLSSYSISVANEILIHAGPSKETHKFT